MFILSISENILVFVCGAGILQAMLLAALIFFHQKSDRSVSTFLALYIICTSGVMIMPFVINIISWQNSFFVQPLPLLPGPMLYLYLRSFKERITLRKALLHFLFFFIFFFPAYWNTSSFSRLYPTGKEVPAALLQHPVTITLMYVRLLHLVIYYFLARRTLASYQRSIQQLFSETSRIDLRWGRLLINGYLILIVTGLLLFPLMIRFPQHFNLLLLIDMAIATPYIYLATYKGIMQPTIWQIQTGTNKEAVQEKIMQAETMETQTGNTEKQKLSKPGINDKMDEIAKNITALMQKDKLYLEAELTLQQLAEKLQLPAYQVSQAINEGMNKNFYDLINGYRVEEAKRLLLDSKNKNFTVLSVGFEAGFNSKTTFNTVFKKFTGLTPTDYRIKQNADLAAV